MEYGVISKQCFPKDQSRAGVLGLITDHRKTMEIVASQEDGESEVWRNGKGTWKGRDEGHILWK